MSQTVLQFAIEHFFQNQIYWIYCIQSTFIHIPMMLLYVNDCILLVRFDF